MQPSTSLNALVTRLRADDGFRDRFVASPASALAEQGFDLSRFNLPDGIDGAALERRLTALDGEAGVDVWSTVEAWADDGAEPTPTVDMVATVVVIYGTSVVTAVVVGGGSDETLDDSGAYKALRRLSKLPPEQLTFTVKGPDGLVAADIGRDVLEAFLARSH